jgi:cytochrome c oxidase subunit 1
MAKTFDDSKERMLATWYLAIAFIALALGGLGGLFQGLEHAGINFYPLPVMGSYYQTLTLHGVLNALVWTTFFISGFLLIAMTSSLKRTSNVIISWVAFVVMMVGVVLAAYAILSGKASVLYTFYVPMKADPLYYIGLTLVVVGTWIHSANFFITWQGWRKDNKNTRTPMATVAAITTWIVWDLATIGVAVEMLWLVIPWSLGIVPETNPLLARTLFWFFGHPLVYFWLLPAYCSWYAMFPQEAGGKLFSDPLARLAFMLFIVLSVPVGVHHQYTDPGIPESVKAVMAAFTFAVAAPSFLTAFNLMATLEYSGKQRGGKGLFGWIFALPWGEPSFLLQALSMILFMFGGIGGLINASYDMNLVIHNTTWVPGHFHLTVGSAVTMTFMGITYWLLPYLTKRKLWNKGVALVQGWLWFFGMAVFSFGLHWAGLMGAPRRVPFSIAVYTSDLIARTMSPYGSAFQIAMGMVAIGGVVMAVSGLLYFMNIILTFFSPKDSALNVKVPEARALSGPDKAPAMLDNFRIWIILAVVLIIVAYGPAFYEVLIHSAWNAPGIPIR